jgi:hypothetical protein
VLFSVVVFNDSVLVFAVVDGDFVVVEVVAS